MNLTSWGRYALTQNALGNCARRWEETPESRQAEADTLDSLDDEDGKP
jgi:hypothetical protein